MLYLKEIIDYGFRDFIVNSLIYFSIVLPFFIVFWHLWNSKFQHRRIQEIPRSTQSILDNEIIYSMISLVIFTILDVMLYVAKGYHLTKFYSNFSDYSWYYFIFSIVLLILLHDTWFYFTHRLMHHPKLYKYIHKVHHQSVDPSPFASFSFHPLEAIIEALFYVLFSFLIPVHIWAFLIWQLLQMVLNVIGHSGYEIYPKWFTNHKLFKWKTPSTHHNMHHSHFSGNYGLYFTWWDKIFKTEFKEYPQKLEQVQKRISEHNQMQAFISKNTEINH